MKNKLNTPELVEKYVNDNPVKGYENMLVNLPRLIRGDLKYFIKLSKKLNYIIEDAVDEKGRVYLHIYTNKESHYGDYHYNNVGYLFNFDCFGNLERIFSDYEHTYKEIKKEYEDNSDDMEQILQSAARLEDLRKTILT